MANRRMFSKDIVLSDRFLSMPPSTQLLYYQLGMEADDDGFIGSPLKWIKAFGANEDELKILQAKQFIIPFETGVVVIKHWKENNQIRGDRYKETIYIEEKTLINQDKNGWYQIGIPNGNQMATIGKPSIGKDSIGEVRLGKDRILTAKAADEINPIIELFKELNPSYERLYSRPPQRAAVDRLMKIHGKEKLSKVITFVNQFRANRFCPTITTPMQLEDKWASLEGFAAKLKSTSNKNKLIV